MLKGHVRARPLRIIAQDPSVRGKNGRILCSHVMVPTEKLSPGPRGYRVAVIDYDSTRGLYQEPPTDLGDAFESASDDQLLGDKHFHAQNVYAIAMCTLSRFEYALGRRVPWSFRPHQLKIAPHAFSEANAFYSARDEALFFGYFPTRDRRDTVYSSLSYDVVAHETTHALIDGLRHRFTDASWPDQLAFHEGFADVVALLSLFAQRPIIATLLGGQGPLAAEDVTVDALRRCALFGLAEQMGDELQGSRGRALRQSGALLPATDYLTRAEFLEPHRRGEVFVAAMLTVFLEIWTARIATLATEASAPRDRDRIVEEGAAVADHLLTIGIRGLDYAPPVDLRFCDFLSATLTADAELHSDDEKYHFRERLLAVFASYGITPSEMADASGRWSPADLGLSYEHSRFEPLTRDCGEVFRFVWENREALGLHPEAFAKVIDVQPAMRQGPDGMFLRETIAEYVEVLGVSARELRDHNVRRPEGMSDDVLLSLHGGGTLIFDDFGRLKYHVKSSIDDPRQSSVLEYLFTSGYFDRPRPDNALARLHLRRGSGVEVDPW